jgi:hypothetical protein
MDRKPQVLHPLGLTYYNVLQKHMGLSRLRRFSERSLVIQAESELTLVNPKLKQNVNANNIVPFARKTVLATA